VSDVFRGTAAAALVAVGHPVDAQTICERREVILAELEQSHRERLAASAVESRWGGVVELYRAADGKWTLLLSLPNGVSCVITWGDEWIAPRERESRS